MKLLLILGVMFALLLASLPVAFSLGSLGLGMLLFEGFSPLMAPQAILSLSLIHISEPTRPY